MGANTIGMLPKSIPAKNIYEFLKKNKGVVSIELIRNEYDNSTYSLKFKYSSTLENGDEMDMYEQFEERDIFISECENLSLDDMEYWREKLNLDNDLSEYTYMSLSSIGCSVDIISSILAEFGGGYLIPNDNREKVIKIDKDNLYNLDLDEFDVAYEY